MLPMRSQAAKHEKERQDLIKNLENRKSNVVHLTHNDFDAVGADAIHQMKYGDIFTIYSSVGKFPHYLSTISTVPGNGDLLSISDLGYKSGVEQSVKKAKQNGWKIEWRDHHRWREDEIKAVQKRVDLLHIETSMCACGICANDLLPDDVIASEIGKVVCDYDLWKHEDPRSQILGLVLQRKKNRQHVRDCMIMGVFEDGTIRKEYEEIKAEMDRAMEKSRKHGKIFGNKYKIVVAPMYGYPSETAAFLRKELNSDVEVLVSKNGRFSIRSVPDISHIVAREFSGGGHPNAAGGNFRFNLFDKLMYLILKRNRHFKIIADIADTI